MDTQRQNLNQCNLGLWCFNPNFSQGDNSLDWVKLPQLWVFLAYFLFLYWWILHLSMSSITKVREYLCNQQWEIRPHHWCCPLVLRFCVLPLKRCLFSANQMPQEKDPSTLLHQKTSLSGWKSLGMSPSCC